MLRSGSSLKVENCSFDQNFAITGGLGMLDDDTTIEFINSNISDNQALKGKRIECHSV